MKIIDFKVRAKIVDKVVFDFKFYILNCTFCNLFLSAICCQHPLHNFVFACYLLKFRRCFESEAKISGNNT